MLTGRKTNHLASRDSWFVIEPSEFANDVVLRAFRVEKDAITYAELEGGYVVDFDGLVEKAERASKAEGETDDRIWQDYANQADMWLQGECEYECED